MEIEDMVLSAAYHSPIMAKVSQYLYSSIDLKVPVPGGTKSIQLRRKIEAPVGQAQNNEEAGAVRYFANTIKFISDAADEFEEEIYADDDERYELVIGKSAIKLDRSRMGAPRLVTDRGTGLSYIDLRSKE